MRRQELADKDARRPAHESRRGGRINPVLQPGPRIDQEHDVERGEHVRPGKRMEEYRGDVDRNSHKTQDSTFLRVSQTQASAVKVPTNSPGPETISGSTFAAAKLYRSATPRAASATQAPSRYARWLPKVYASEITGNEFPPGVTMTNTIIPVRSQ